MLAYVIYFCYTFFAWGASVHLVRLYALKAMRGHIRLMRPRS